MAATTRIYHIELTDDDGAGPIEGVAMILISDDAVSQAAKDAGVGEARRRCKITVPRAAVGTMLQAARRVESDPVLDALPSVIAAQS